MSESTKGLWAILTTCVIWGLFALYFNLLRDVPPLEVLAHRTLWSFVFFGLMMLIERRWNEIVAILRSAKLWQVAAAALAISSNWFVYIVAVSHGRVVEASLGYFIFPLVAVLVGIFVYGERLGPVKGGAVLLAAVAVTYLAWGLHAAPWIALLLAGSMCIYGILKKGLPFAADVTVTVEVMLLTPLAIAVLLAMHFGWGFPAESGSFGRDWSTSLLLIFSGILTGVPLVLFGYGAQRVSMGTLGLTFYINPTLQFLVAVLALGEPLTVYHMIAFPLIWIALAIYTTAQMREHKTA